MSLLPGWVYRAGRHSRAGALWRPSPAQRGLWFLPESRNLKSNGKTQRNRGHLSALPWCSAEHSCMHLCLPSAHVFKHQLLTAKYLKRQSLVTKSTEGKYKSFKWNTGCPQLWCHTAALEVFSRDYLCVSVHIYVQSKHADMNMHPEDHGVSARSVMREKWLQPSMSIDHSSLPHSESNASRLHRSYFKTWTNTAKCCRNTFNFM